MEYKSLSKLFYSDSDNYKKIYNERFNNNIQLMQPVL